MYVNTKEDARKTMIKVLKKDLFYVYSGKPGEPAAFLNFLPKAIMDSIDEGIDECYKGYSSTEWDIWGFSYCIDVIKGILKQKVINFKTEYKKNLKTNNVVRANFLKTKEVLPKEIEDNIKEYLGGKKRRTRKTSKRSRKSKRKISKRQRKTKRRRSKSK